MPNKIVEKIVEPSKIKSGSTFRLKVKAIRYMIYEELKEQNVSKIKDFKVNDLKGEGV